MLLLLSIALSAPSAVRPEPVESRPAVSGEERPSPSAGRAEKGGVIEAERAFAADAQRLGQWTAFRKWAAPDATMFVPQPVNAQAWLKDRADPAKAVAWLPAQAYVSCDGKLAATTGPWRRPDGSVGYFTTIWARRAQGGWRWLADHGDTTPSSSFDTALAPKVTRASCAGGRRWGSPPSGLFAADSGDRDGSSPDGTLLWYWSVSRTGARAVRIALWNGEDWYNAIWDRVGYPDRQTEPAPKP